MFFEKGRLQIDDRSAGRGLLGHDLDRCAGELFSDVLQIGVDLLRLLIGGHLLPSGRGERPRSTHGPGAERNAGGRKRLHHGAAGDAPASVIGNRARDRHLVAIIERLFHFRVLLCRPGNVERTRCVDQRNALSAERLRSAGEGRPGGNTDHITTRLASLLPALAGRIGGLTAPMSHMWGEPDSTADAEARRAGDVHAESTPI